MGSDMGRGGGTWEHGMHQVSVWHGVEQEHDETRDWSDILNKRP